VDLTKQGALLRAARQNEEALEACDAALKIAPGYLLAHRLRILVLLELKRHDDLIKSCDTLLKTGKPEAELYELRGMAKDGLKDLEGAIADYSLSLALKPENARLLRRRGWWYLEQDALRPAADDFSAAIRLAPTSADAYCGRALVRARLGQHGDAVGDAEEAIRCGQPNWRIAYNAACVYGRVILAASAEARRAGLRSARQVSQYEDRAVELVRLAIKLAPAQQRTNVIRESMDEPSLQTIRRRLRAIDSTKPSSPSAD
jgi:tetratricopeptide (TPR) repeat protein